MEYIDRLIRCGIPHKTAVRIYRDFIVRDAMPALIAYLHYVERLEGIA